MYVDFSMLDICIGKLKTTFNYKSTKLKLKTRRNPDVCDINITSASQLYIQS